MTINVGQRGEIVIPKKIREAKRFTAGGRVIITETDEGLLIQPVSGMETMVDEFEKLAKKANIRFEKPYDSDEAYDEMMEEYTRVHR